MKALNDTPTATLNIDEEKPYSAPRIYLHWVSAVVIIWATLSGFGVTLLPPSSPFRQWVESVNPQVATLFIPVFIWRVWLYIKALPKSTDRKGRTQKKIAALTHGMIYLSVTGVLVTGVLMMNHPIVLLATLPFPQLVHSPTALADLKVLHHASCVLLAGLLVLHIAAVIQHQIRGRSVLRRMRRQR